MPQDKINGNANERIRRRFARGVRSGSEAEAAYDRRLHLPRLLPLDPDAIADFSVEASRRIVRRLASALRSERTRGRAGHWTYDLNRHLALIQAYRAERRRLRERAGGDAGG